CVAAQPAVHAVLKRVPHGSLQHGNGSGIGHTDVVIIGSQLALVIVVVTAICFAERLVLALTGAIYTCWVRFFLLPVHPAPAVVPRRAASEPKRSSQLVCRDTMIRRGPPHPLCGILLPA
ncbi:MAG: hypothetical protein NTV51_02895, partial [Verrucomicrobia bacterium]|nr:hypothetical protein [Verrucomicrobiota bacterium]